MLLLLLSHFSRVRLCATPWTAAHQAPPSLGFSRQEHWSGLPFPSPMHESEKWKWSRSVVSDSFRPHGLQPTRLLYPWDFPGKSTGVGCHCLLWQILDNHHLFQHYSKTISNSTTWPSCSFFTWVFFLIIFWNSLGSIYTLCCFQLKKKISECFQEDTCEPILYTTVKEHNTKGAQQVHNIASLDAGQSTVYTKLSFIHWKILTQCLL